MKHLLLVCSLLFFMGKAKAQDSLVWSLNDCIQYAMKNNISIKKKALDKQSAEVNYIQQKNNKLPLLSGSSSLNVSNGSTIDPITSNFVSQTIIANSYGLNGQLVLYQGNKLNLEVDKNELIISQSALYQKEAENNIKLSIIEAYIQTLYYKEGIAIAENAVRSSAEELTQTKAKFSNGSIARKDLSDIETQHATNQYNVVSAKNLYLLQELKLKQFLELNPSVEFKISDMRLSDVSEDIPDKQSLFSKAAENLPDLKIYDLQDGILNKELKITKAGYLPTLSMSGGLNTGYTNTMGYTFADQIRRNFSQQGGLSLSIPIFSKRTNANNVKLARINLQQNKLDKISAQKTLYSKIETAWQNAVSNQAQQNAARTTTENAELAYNLARRKYEFGGLTTTELSVSRNTYLSAAQNYLQSKLMAVLYKELLTFYSGDLK
ncbi:MAG: TolC family protein [Chitinophagaceae bacterium]